MIIAVSGSPATGKTQLAKKLSEKMGYKYLDVNKFIKENNLSNGYDKKRDCEIVDVYNLNKELLKFIDKNIIIDSHLSHYLPPDRVDYCIITKCKIKELKKRLIKRGYSQDKIRENLDAEIFDTCLVEAEERDHNIIVVDTTDDFNTEEIISKLK